MPLDTDKLNSLKLDRDADDRRRRRRVLPVALVVAAVALAALAAGFMLRNGDPDAPIVRTARASAPSAGNRSDAVLNASGYVVARRLATVSSKVTGRVSEVLIEEGMNVSEGDVLARLDAATANAQFQLAAAQRDASRKDLAEVQVRVNEARRNLKRTEALVADKLVSESVLDSAKAEVDALVARLDAARSSVEVASRSLAVREQDVEDLVIRAPFSGVVISKNAQPGEMISPISAGGGFTRTGICTIVDMDSREIEVDVNEAYINRVSAGQPTVAQLDAYTDWDIPSRVINIVPTADRQRATVKVRIGFDELDPRILPDMGVKVTFLEESVTETPSPESEAVARIPENAVYGSANGTYAFVVADGRVERRTIRIGQASRGSVPVLSGVRPGERVAIDADDLADGMDVRTE